jgi:hypothetical protein
LLLKLVSSRHSALSLISGQKIALAVALTVLLCGALAAPAFAAKNELSVGSLPAEFVVGAPGVKDESITLQIFVSSSEPQSVVVEFVDFFTGDSGERSQLPAGSTPYSLANILKIEPYDSYYPGGGRQQLYEVVIRPKENFDLALFTGGVLVVLKPEGNVGSGVSTASSILRSITVTPFGLAASLAEGDLLPAKIVRHDLKRLKRSSFIDSVMPDIPGVVNFGPVESTVIYKNLGEYPVFAGVRWEFISDDTVVASKQFRPSPLSPGQQVRKSVTTEVSGVTENSKLNLLPGFGWVSNKISLTSSLGGTDLPIQSYDGSFLVIQWKEPFVALLALYFLVRWAWRKNLSKRKKEESASLIWLAMRDFYRKRFPRRSTSNDSSTERQNLEVQLQGLPPKVSSPNRYDIKPARPSLLDPTQQGAGRQDPPSSRF